MSDKPVGKVLRPCKELFDGPKEVGDLIWSQHTEGVNKVVLKALASTGKVEWFVDTADVDQGLDTRIKILEKQVEDMLNILQDAGLTNSQPSTPAKAKAKTKAKAKAKKK